MYQTFHWLQIDFTICAFSREKEKSKISGIYMYSLLDMFITVFIVRNDSITIGIYMYSVLDMFITVFIVKNDSIIIGLHVCVTVDVPSLLFVTSCWRRGRYRLTSATRWEIT